MSFALIGTGRDDAGRLTVIYDATLFDDGKHKVTRCKDTWFPPIYRNGELTKRGHFLNTSPSVSYYNALLRAAKVNPL